MTAILIFKCTEGASVGDYSCSFDTHARQQLQRKALDLDDLTEKYRTVNSLEPWISMIPANFLGKSHT